MTRDELFARTCEERNLLDAEVQLLRLEKLSDKARLAELQAELDECQEAARSLDQILGESQRARQDFTDHIYRLEASRGEIVPACPQCQCIDPKAVVYACEEWHCARCLAEFTEPAYWQRVKGPA